MRLNDLPEGMVETMPSIHPQALTALEAVKMRRRVGRHAARLFAQKKGASSLYRLACQLEAMKDW